MSKFQWSIIIFILIEGGLYFQFQGDALFYPLLISGLIVYIFLLFFFSMNLSSNFFIEAYKHAKEGTVALTFDDGPHPEMTLKILDILDRYNAKAAFFIIGKNAEEYPEIVKEIYRRGHLIGSHSYSHPLSFGFLSSKKVGQEIMDGIKIVEEILQSKVLYFRPPFGITNPRIAKTVRKNSLQLIAWNLRSFDTARSDFEGLLQKLNKNTKSGSIILLHDTVPGTVEILPRLLENMRDKNLLIEPNFE